MNIFKKLYKICCDPAYRFGFLYARGLYDKISDEEFIRKAFKAKMGKELDLEHPQTFNEKMQWLKLYDRKPIYTTMVDKYAVKKYVSDIIGEEYIIPVIGVWDIFDEIDFRALPNQFVLKCTHDSGGLVIVRDKNNLDIAAVKKKIEKSLNSNYYRNAREWPYKNVKPQILAEKYMEDKTCKNLVVYKFFTFSGEVKIIQVIQNDKTQTESIDYFDNDWNLLDLRQNFPNSKQHLPRPETLDQMLNLAKRLSKNLPFVRVDLYEINGKNYFSEYTFYSDGGFVKFYPEEWDKILGEYIKI